MDGTSGQDPEPMEASSAAQEEQVESAPKEPDASAGDKSDEKMEQNSEQDQKPGALPEGQKESTVKHPETKLKIGQTSAGDKSEEKMDQKSEQDKSPIHAGMTRDEQRDFVKKHRDKKLEFGQIWYIVDYKWFEAWKDYVHFSKSLMNRAPPKANAANPGKVDNRALLIPDGTDLRERILEDIDFEFVAKEIWETFITCYGFVEGQAPLQRTVVEEGKFIKQMQVELYLMELFLSHYKNPTDGKSMKFSRTVKVGALEKKMREVFKISELAETKLLYCYTSTRYDELDDPEENLSAADLQPRQYVVIVEKEGAVWPNPDLYKTSTVFIAPKTNVNKARPFVSSRNTYGNAFCKDGSPGLCGLSNLGNTCFMNSALQCLSNVPKLTHFFTVEDWIKDLNRRNVLGMKGHVAERYAELVVDMWKGTISAIRAGDTSLARFKRVVGDFAPRFRGYQQHDSHELMIFLLDGLHEDLNRIRVKPIVLPRESDGRPDKEVAADAWSDYKKRNDSIIVDLFHGQLRSTLQCPICEHTSITFDPFCYLPLPIPGPDRGLKKLVIHYVSADSTAAPIKCKIRVPSDGTLEDVCSEVASLFDTSSDKLFAVNIHNHQVFKIFDSNDPVDSIRDYYDTIFVYELNVPDGHLPAAVYFQTKESLRRYPIHANLSWPMLIALPEETTYAELVDLIRPLSRRFVDEDKEDTYFKEMEASEKSDREKDTVKGDNDSHPALNNGAEPMEVSNCSKATPSARPSLFELHAVSQHNDRLPNDIQADETPIIVKSKPTFFLALFETNLIRKVIDSNKGLETKDHANLNEPVKNSVTLQECLHDFTAREKLGKLDTWYCPTCKDHVQAFKQFHLWKMPQYLVIQLKRYRSSQTTYSYVRDKIDTPVTYPIEDLDLSDHVISDESLLCHYDLIAVSNHFGGLGGGHYTAYAKNHGLDKWYYFDDASITSAADDSPVSKSAYLLIYEKKQKQKS